MVPSDGGDGGRNGGGDGGGHGGVHGEDVNGDICGGIEGGSAGGRCGGSALMTYISDMTSRLILALSVLFFFTFMCGRKTTTVCINIEIEDDCISVN